jgi:hypothetical protein
LEQWDDFLPAVLWAYRTKPNDTIRATPYEVMFGVEANDANKVMRAMKVPIVRLQQIRADRRDAALTSLIAIQQQRKEKFDERHAERKLDIGDLVLKFHGPMLDKKGKLLKKWHGPYIVAKKIGHAAYQLEDEKGILRRPVNVEFVKPFRGPVPEGLKGKMKRDDPEITVTKGVPPSDNRAPR